MRDLYARAVVLEGASHVATYMHTNMAFHVVMSNFHVDGICWRVGGFAASILACADDIG